MAAVRDLDEDGVRRARKSWDENVQTEGKAEEDPRQDGAPLWLLYKDQESE